jgi:hypothetical protein
MLALPGTRSDARVPAICFEPVFKPHKQDLCFYKGADFNFSLLVADYPIDFRGASFAMEIRPPNGDVRQIKNVLGSTAVNTSVIKLEFEKLDCSGECKTDRDIKKLESLPINEGDFVTLEGSGVTMFPVLSVTASSILVEGVSSRDVAKGRVFFRFKSDASFFVSPAFTPEVVATETPAAIGATVLFTQSLPRELSAGTILVFADANSNTILATLTDNAPLGGRLLAVQPMESPIEAGALANIDAFAIILTAETLQGGNTLTVPAIPASIPVGTPLNFSRRTGAGWEFLSGLTVQDTAPVGSTTITFDQADGDLPIGAIAYFGTVPFNALNIGITADDTRQLHLNEYKYDLIARLADGEKLAILKGAIKFDGYVSDFI